MPQIPGPCIVREGSTDISAEEDSLAENAHRAALHPLDQFRAFRTLRDQGLTEEEIANLLPTTDKNIDEMFNELTAMLQTLQHPAIKALANAYLDGLAAARVRPGRCLWERFADFLPVAIDGELSLGEGGDFDESDGVRYALPDRWVHLRRSNTEPVLRIITDAGSEQEAEELVQLVRKALEG